MKRKIGDWTVRKGVENGVRTSTRVEEGVSLLPLVVRL